MKQKETIRSLWMPTAGMLSGARRVAMLLLTTLLLTMTALTAQAETFNYLDASGASQSHDATPVTGSSLGTNGSVTWYVVNSDVELTSGLDICGTVHLILADNKTLSVPSSVSGIYMYENSSLTIYSQSLGSDMGKLVINSSYPIYIGANSLTINGGDISVTTNDSGVYLAANGSMTINNGTVSLTGSDYGVYNDEGSLTITGGTVTIAAQTPIRNTNNYIKTGGTVTLNSTSGGGTVNVSYLDASGAPQSVDATPVTDGYLSAGNSEKWYVVNSNVTLTTGLEFQGNVHLILADNTTLSVTSSDHAIYMYENSSLTIYSQSLGSDMGKLVINSNYPISIGANSLTINGGDISVTTNDNAVYLAAGGSMTINNGTVSLTGKDYGVSNEYGSLTINGGTVTIIAQTPIMNTSNYTSNGGTVTLKDKYEVIFDANGGSDISAVFVALGGTVSKPEDPTRDGYVFVGWYNGANEYDFTAAVTTDLTLTAKWGKNIANCTATVPNQTMERFGGGYPYPYIYFKFEDAENNPTSNVIGEVVKDGETTLTLGTDYEFGQITFAEPSTHDEKVNPCKPGDKCRVEIIGLGTYVGTAYADFTIISPSANGTYGGLSWSVADGTLSITGRGAMTAAASTNAYPWYNYCSIITTISIGEGVTSIADNAFGSQPNIYTYNNVAKVTIPSTVTSIGADAFKGCISATDVYCYADPTKLTWSDTNNDFKSDGSTVCHVADISAWSEFSNVLVTFEGDLADVSIPYIDADGSTKFCTNFTVLNGTETTLSAGWYVAQGTVNYTGCVTLNGGDVNLILTDNAVVNIGTSSGPISADYCIWGGNNSLTIYGQSTEGDKVGQLNAYNSSGPYHAVSVKNYTQYGGKVTIDDTGNDALYFEEGDLTLARGTLTAKAHDVGRCAILLNNGHTATVSGGTLIATATGEYSSAISGNLTMTGGTLNATGEYSSAISGNLTMTGGTLNATGQKGIIGDATLGWTNASDRITASSYNGTVTIVAGQMFVNDATTPDIVSDTVSDMDKVNGKTLKPITGVTLTKDGSGELTASLDPSSEGEVSIPVPVEVDHVEVDRTYENNKASTVYLPFSIAASKVSGGKFHTFTGVNEATTPWTVTYNEVTGDIAANTPYIFLPNDDNGGKIVVNNTEKITVGTGIASTPQTSGDWAFIGTYERIKWTHDTTDPEYTAAREAEIGSVYGFSAVDNGTDQVGDFVKVGNNVFINPMRAYLKKGSASPARAMAPGAQTQQLPDKMKVVIISASGETTEIGTLDTRTGEITLDVWYSLDGRRLSGKPITKGVYINNGKTVVVK